jgi:hypothetical protein
MHKDNGGNMSAEENEVKDTDSTLTHLILLIVGGISTGAGLINLYYSFGWAQGYDSSNARIPMNTDLDTLGFTGLDNIYLLSSSSLAFPLVFVGVAMMVMANATAWRQTGGY